MELIKNQLTQLRIQLATELLLFDGHIKIIQAIESSNQSIRMWMFHLTDPAVVDALVAANRRGVKTEIILNHAMFEPQQQSSQIDKQPRIIDESKSLADSVVISKLTSATTIKVFKSTSAFSITHAKTLIIDSTYAWITSMNLTMNFPVQRDSGIKIQDQTVIDDLNQLFDADITNAADQGNRTPIVSSSSLIISPTNSTSKLNDFIDSAKVNIFLTVENFSKGELSDHLLMAIKNGISVRVITPFCDMNSNHYFNVPILQILKSANAQVHVMPSPASANFPYMHQKMIIVDGKIAFIGSENFTANSLLRAREIGIITNTQKTVISLNTDFEADWQNSIELDPGNNQPPCNPI